MRLDAEFLLDLVRVRILLAGSGLIGRPEPHVAVAILPGGHILRIFQEERAHLRARILHPAGNALSGEVVVSDATSFANLMHTIDKCIHRTFPDVPLHLFPLADEIVWHIHHLGAEVSLPKSLDLPDPIANWSPPAAGLQLIEMMGREGMGRSTSVEGYLYGDDERLDAQAFVRSSLLRWLEQMDGWLMQDKGMVPLSIQAEENEWIRVETVPGLLAAARGMGRSDGYAGPSADPPSLESISTVQKAFRRNQTIRTSFLDGDVSYYVLRGGELDRRIIACVLVDEGTFVAMGATGNSRSREHLEALGDSLGMSGHAYRF